MSTSKQRSYRLEANAVVTVVADLQALAVASAQEFADQASAAIKRSGRFTVALSGGSTPKPQLARLASAHADLDWRKIHFFWGDERCVPPTDDASNYKMAKEQLLDHVPVPAANIHRMHAEDPATAAAAYELELQRTFQLQPGMWPRFDLVLLGIGDEGHTASLFPGTTAQHDFTHSVARNYVGKLHADRITLTYPAINAAHCVLVLVSGASKSAIVRQVLETPVHSDEYPVQGVRPSDGRLLWMLDAAAAAGLG